MKIGDVVRGFVVVDKDGDIIGIDSASGGYPYKAFNINTIKIWDKVIDAAKYTSIMNSGSYGHFEVKAILFKFGE